MTDKILIDRELLERAYKALVYVENNLDCSGPSGLTDDSWMKVSEELRAALDAPQQEAVAWMLTNKQSGDVEVAWDTEGFPRELWQREPLYLHPAPQQEAVATVKRNAAGQIYMVGADGKSFDVSKYIGESFYLHPAPSVPEGWQPVPKEPTPDMIIAGNDGFRSPDSKRHTVSSCYKAMLSASPQAPTTDDRKVRSGRTDTDRLLWLTLEEFVPEGFVHVEADRYEYAMQVAEERGHDEPTDDDCLEGLRRLLDCAMDDGNKADTQAPN